MLNEIWADICEQWIQPVSGKWWEIIIFVPSERRRYRFK